ncbi:31631_t:CDS:2 [Gigaspora margarita]|uniref:31631_t:CDS:1 n=1 Tax=Gigaspora margarita TaxID=4874 RepID=A0ABN7V655_GIGMA|nr:31631_t:CDS:2 [Gigaspora margarita]
MIKKYPQVSTGDLHAIHQKLFLALENQYREVQTMVSQEKIQIPYVLNNQFYAQVVTKNQSSIHISSEPENSLQQWWQEYNQQFNSWSSFRQAIVLNQLSNLFLEPTIVLQNLQIQYTKGHPVGAKNIVKSSIYRDPFRFKLVEPNKHIRKCGLYQKIRYNSRTCNYNNSK